MNRSVLRVFDEILSKELIEGPVLEIGALPGPDSLLQRPALSGITRRVGLNLTPFPSTDAITMITGNANSMCMFADGEFQCVLCNSTLEHDAYFWKTLAEIRRVTASGGLIVIGVPGFRGMGPRSFAPSGSWLSRLLNLLAALTGHDALKAGTVTLGEHHYPGDYYRFTEQAVREIFLQDLVASQCRWVMHPPRVIGWARKP